MLKLLLVKMTLKPPLAPNVAEKMQAIHVPFETPAPHDHKSCVSKRKKRRIVEDIA